MAKERRQNKRPEPIEVNVSKVGYIRIAQDDPQGIFTNLGQVVVTVDVDDADQIISWIQEVKAEILEARASGETFDDDQEDDNNEN